MLVPTPTAAKGFAYDASPQGSPEWIALRAGKVTASRLSDWLSVSKRDGKPLKSRKDYELELQFERQFKVPFTRFVTRAMEEGVAAEDEVANQYASLTGNSVETCGAFYSKDFVASPDRLVGEDGLLEIKWLYDMSFMDILQNGVPDNYMLQIQGQLMASGRKWCDFAAGNGNTNKMKIIRVKRDTTIIKQIKESLANLEEVFGEFDVDGVYTMTTPMDFESAQPQGEIWA